MDTVLFAAFAVAYTGLLAWGVLLAVRHGRLTPADLPLLVVAGLVYDNTVIALGRWIGEGALLEGLNLGRFWIHALVTPLLVVWAWHAVRRTGAAWARTRAAALAAVLLTIGLMVLEIVTVNAGLRIEPREEYGVLSYSNAEAPGGPPLMVLVVAAALIAAGFVVGRRQRWIWLLVGAVVMTAGSALPIPVESGAVTNAFELALLTAILATKAHQDRSEAHLTRGDTARRARDRRGTAAG